MNREELLERYNNFYQYYSYDDFISMLFECKQRKQNKESLIKYIENFISKTDYEVNIKGNYLYIAWSNAYKDLLERIKNNNYES